MKSFYIILILISTCYGQSDHVTISDGILIEDVNLQNSNISFSLDIASHIFRNQTSAALKIFQNSSQDSLFEGENHAENSIQNIVKTYIAKYQQKFLYLLDFIDKTADLDLNHTKHGIRAVIEEAQNDRLLNLHVLYLQNFILKWKHHFDDVDYNTLIYQNKNQVQKVSNTTSIQDEFSHIVKSHFNELIPIIGNGTLYGINKSVVERLLKFVGQLSSLRLRIKVVKVIFKEMNRTHNSTYIYSVLKIIRGMRQELDARREDNYCVIADLERKIPEGLQGFLSENNNFRIQNVHNNEFLYDLQFTQIYTHRNFTDVEWKILPMHDDEFKVSIYSVKERKCIYLDKCVHKVSYIRLNEWLNVSKFNRTEYINATKLNKFLTHFMFELILNETTFNFQIKSVSSAEYLSVDDRIDCIDQNAFHPIKLVTTKKDIQKDHAMWRIDVAKRNTLIALDLCQYSHQND